MNRTSRTNHRIVGARFLRAEGGVAIVEFALVLPVLMTLLYGTVEITRYILITQKVEKMAHSVADVTAQSATASLATLNQVMAAASDIMKPYSMSTNGRIIISSLYRPQGEDDASINWRHQSTGGLSVTSQLGAIGAIPTMPTGFVFEERENVIAAEVYYQFSPLISSQFFGTTTVYRIAFYKPRLGALISTPT
jgi:Flp pilus assembly protein TadG